MNIKKKKKNLFCLAFAFQVVLPIMKFFIYIMSSSQLQSMHFFTDSYSLQSFINLLGKLTIYLYVGYNWIHVFLVSRRQIDPHSISQLSRVYLHLT